MNQTFLTMWRCGTAVFSVLAMTAAGLGSCARGGAGEASGPDEVPVFRCTDSGVCDSMYCDQVLIAGGEFIMGADQQDKVTQDSPGLFRELDHTPSHEVNLNPYCIDTYEVTLERYTKCVHAGGCDPTGHMFSEEGNKPIVPEGAVYVNHYPDECGESLIEKGTNCPHRAVNSKTYAQAKQYCEWIGRRLCTEAQWERAAKGPPPEQILYPWGNEELSAHYTNIAPEGGEGYVEAVNGFENGKSKEGVHNLVGNVFEWVADYYAPYGSSESGDAVQDPEGPAEGEKRVCRGGCAFSPHGISNVARLAADPTFDWG